MTQDHRRLAEEVAQGVLIDDPTFLKEIVERVSYQVRVYNDALCQRL
jgi:hypothetical protein